MYIKCDLKKITMLSSNPFLRQYLSSTYNISGPVLSQKKYLFGSFFFSGRKEWVDGAEIGKVGKFSFIWSVYGYKYIFVHQMAECIYKTTSRASGESCRTVFTKVCAFCFTSCLPGGIANIEKRSQPQIFTFTFHTKHSQLSKLSECPAHIHCGWVGGIQTEL